MARLFTALMVSAFFLFINVAAALLSPTSPVANPLASTVALFQWIADIIFILGLVFLTIKGLQKLIGRLGNGQSATPRARTSRYRYDRSPLNMHDGGWRMVDTQGSLPFTDTPIGTRLPHTNATPLVQNNRERHTV